MICIGEISEVKTKLEQMVDTYFPDGFSDVKLVAVANDYEHLLRKH